MSTSERDSDAMSILEAGLTPELSSATAKAAAELAADEVTHTAQLEDIVRTHWKGGVPAKVPASSTRRWVITSAVVIVFVGAMIWPLVWATNRLHQTSSTGVVGDLTQFSLTEQGLPANQAAVTRVERDATRTVVGGTTVWAERSGNQCWGVVVSGGSASTPQLQEASLCR
jgi:hypothetical protein